MAIVRDEQLAVDTRLTVEVDGVRVDDAPLWPANIHRGGFGTPFGLGAFGFDDATGPGLSGGELGAGHLGSDGTACRWRHDDLDGGLHNIEVKAQDTEGHSSAGSLALANFNIETLPTPVRNLAVGTNFVLSWSQ